MESLSEQIEASLVLLRNGVTPAEMAKAIRTCPGVVRTLVALAAKAGAS